jgi:hypothetical protein
MRLSGAVRPLPSAFAVLLAAGVLSACAWRTSEPPHLSIKDTWPAPISGAHKRVKRTAAAPASSAPAETSEHAQSAQIAAAEDCRDAASCDRTLRALIDSRDRVWIIRPPTAQEYLSGVRMLAYRVLRPRLTCGELAVGVEELRRTPEMLASPPAGSKPDDVKRVLSLAERVQEELRAERQTRCQAPATSPSQPRPAPSPGKTEAPGPAPDNSPAQAPPAAPKSPAQ